MVEEDPVMPDGLLAEIAGRMAPAVDLDEQVIDGEVVLVMRDAEATP